MSNKVIWFVTCINFGMIIGDLVGIHELNNRLHVLEHQVADIEHVMEAED